MPPAHEPERTCVGCRAKGPKRDLLRIARTADGTVALDRSGRGDGRGAYVHRREDCVDVALSRGAVFRVLRARAGEDAAARLRRAIEGELRA
jgi:predicted RNA-binding protein YlxR (DUF448 family)